MNTTLYPCDVSCASNNSFSVTHKVMACCASFLHTEVIAKHSQYCSLRVIMIHFLVSLVAILNLLSPVISMPFEGTRFSCRGEFEPVDRPTKHLPEGKSNDVIYIKSGMEHLNISCVLVGQNGMAKIILE